jgi:hypothetical protein
MFESPSFSESNFIYCSLGHKKLKKKLSTDRKKKLVCLDLTQFLKARLLKANEN